MGSAATDTQLQQIAQAYAMNQGIQRATQWQWVQLANDLGSSPSPNYATGTYYRFRLANASAYVRALRVWFHSVKIDNSSGSAAGATNRSGIYAFLGTQLRVTLGNEIYRIASAFIPLLAQTFKSMGQQPSYPGIQATASAYTDLTASLFSAPSSVAESGSSIYTGYMDIPFTWMEKVNDPDGITPTLSNTGIQVEFTTPNNLQGTDPLANPFTAAGTLAVDSSAPGTIDIWASIARLVTTTTSGNLQNFIVGPSFIIAFTSFPLLAGPQFYPFQGEQAELILAKSLMVIDNPGALSGEYDNPQNVLQMDLQYDATTPIINIDTTTDPMLDAGVGGPMNWYVDQRKAIGDQPPGVYVWDFVRGYNADYPTALDLALNIEEFSKAGVMLQYGGTIETGALLYFCNMYVRPNFFQARS